VEMADLGADGTVYEAGVIDEIQMLADPQRGWAFTQALLGLPVKTLYLCGEEAALPLIQALCKETGEQLEVHRFSRLSPLTVPPKSLQGGLKDGIQPGDCLVAFSRRKIFDLKAQVERATGRKCAVVYGGLPMESRAQQAKLFNTTTGGGCEVMVASDAIGMGLNLAIKRVIFQSLSKFNGEEVQLVAPNQVKQIAGRAGRFGTSGAASDGGQATTLLKKDLAYLQSCMERPNEAITAAGLLPSADHIANISAANPSLTLTAILDLYSNQDNLKVNDSYFMCQFRDMHRLAAVLAPHLHLPMPDRFQLARAPVKPSDALLLSTYRNLVSAFAHPAAAPVPLRINVPRMTRDPEGSLLVAESVYRSLDLYLWLATHFPERFLQIAEARERREECGKLVDQALSMICHVRGNRKASQSVKPLAPVTRPAEQFPTSSYALDDIDRLITEFKAFKPD